MNVVAFALTSIAMSVLAQFLLRFGMARLSPSNGACPIWLCALLQPHVIFGLALYAGSAVIWLGVLARWEVSKAYPMVGLGFVAAAIIGFFAGETVSTVRWLGVGLVFVGVCLIGRS